MLQVMAFCPASYAACCEVAAAAVDDADEQATSSAVPGLPLTIIMAMTSYQALIMVALHKKCMLEVNVDCDGGAGLPLSATRHELWHSSRICNLLQQLIASETCMNITKEYERFV